jgi:hypothetical protein
MVFGLYVLLNLSQYDEHMSKSFFSTWFSFYILVLLPENSSNKDKIRRLKFHRKNWAEKKSGVLFDTSNTKTYDIVI